MAVGKLNYAHRKIDGEKLATVVKKDLLKRTTSKSPHARDSQIELVLSGKKLGTNFETVCHGIVSSSTTGATRLSELHLDGNELDLEALQPLAEVVRASRRDLKILNVSHNLISIKPNKDISIWLDFLRALSSCRELTTLDLSGNPLGDKAVECFAMIYCRETTKSDLAHAHSTMFSDLMPSLDETCPVEVNLVPSSDDETSGSDLTASSSPENSHQNSPRLSRSNTFNMATGPPHAMLGLSRGLRALISLQLDDTNLTDAGALCLSYILEHFSCNDTPPGSAPERTKFHFRAFPNDTTEIAAQTSNGVKYSGNDFSAPAQKLLETAEKIDDTTSDYGTASPSASPLRRRSSTTTARSPERRRPSISCDGNKRVPAAPTAQTDLERLRTKVEGLLIKDDQESALELWRVALQVIKVIRVVCSATSSDTCHGLPVQLWQTIVVAAVDEHQFLSQAQIAAIFCWALNPDCLSIERDWDHKLLHVKVWRTLEAVQSLGYVHLE